MANNEKNQYLIAFSPLWLLLLIFLFVPHPTIGPSRELLDGVSESSPLVLLVLFFSTSCGAMIMQCSVLWLLVEPIFLRREVSRFQLMFLGSLYLMALVLRSELFYLASGR